jgi:hypothetical protein
MLRIRYNKDGSKYTKNILNHQHEYDTKCKTMALLKIMNEGSLMDTYEKNIHCIHKYRKYA